MRSTRQRIDDLMPIVSRLDKKLSNLASMLTYAGRLIHLNYIISSMSIFSMCSINVQFTIIDHVEKACMNFHWYGKDINKHGRCLVKWGKICLPKYAGGVGVLDLRQHNRALDAKNI